MIEGLVDWVAGLPAVTIYFVLTLLACLENIFPPVPADTAFALGGLLSFRGTINAWWVLGLSLAANVAGAMGIYFLAARHSTTIFDSSLSRRLLPENGVAFVRKEYRRFGLLGLFIARLLPGFRAIVPPFAGMIHLPPIRVALVLTAASVLWYGTILYVAIRLGERWNDIAALLGHVNRGLGIAALVAVLGLGYWAWRRRRRRANDNA